MVPCLALVRATHNRGGKLGVGAYSPAQVFRHGLVVKAVQVVERAGTNGDDGDGLGLALGLIHCQIVETVGLRILVFRNEVY
jgi:hypothetical protein